MTDGMEIQEPSEAPEKISEVSEESKRVDDVTFEPEAVIEREMDIETAEAVEKAFVEVVQTSSADGSSAWVFKGDGDTSIRSVDERVTTLNEKSDPALEGPRDGVSVTFPDPVNETPDEGQTAAGTSAEDAVDEVIAAAEKIADEVDETEASVMSASIGSPSIPGGQVLSAAISGGAGRSADEGLAEDDRSEGGSSSNEFDVPETESSEESVSGVESPSGEASDTGSAFETDMTGASSGEVRGFENDDGTKAYVLRSDGNIGFSEFSEYVLQKNEIEAQEEDSGSDLNARESTSESQGESEASRQNEQAIQDLTRLTQVISPIVKMQTDTGKAVIENLRGDEDDEDLSSDDTTPSPVIGAADGAAPGQALGDKSQLTNIELQNMLQKQQQLIQMLSNISKALEDSPLSDIRKVSGGGDSGSSDSSESSNDQPEGTTDPVIEAEAAALVEEVLAAETPEDAAALVQSVLRESYKENSQDLAFHAQKVKYFNECKKQVRTYLTQIEEKAQDLNEADSQANSEGTEPEYSYQLVEGRILVGESDVIEPTDNPNDDDGGGGEDGAIRATYDNLSAKTSTTQDTLVNNLK